MMKIRKIKGGKKPIAGNYKDIELQWLWNGEWITASVWDIDYYVRKYGCDELIEKTINHIKINEEGLYPQWAGCEGSERVKRFFDELWNKKYSVDRLCKEHQLTYILQIGE